MMNDIAYKKKTQRLPTFDPISIKFLGYKSRDDIHREGDWHIGVQAHIVRKNHYGSFDILIQKRSGFVDIGKYNYDQSLAVQLGEQDELSLKRSLDRGLREELGISQYHAYWLPVGHIAIIKKYPDDPGLLNREYIYLYLVTLPQYDIAIQSKKVQEIFWLSWEELIGLIRSKGKMFFTRTARFYFENPLLRQYIEDYTRYILGLQNSNRYGRMLYHRCILNLNIFDVSSVYYFSQSEKIRYSSVFSQKYYK